MSLSKTVTVTFSWDQLALELDRLAPGETQQVMIPYLVSSLQKQSPFMNSELLLREIVSTVACISDQTFPLDLAVVFGATDQSRDSP
jgi:hypothetical protein